MSAMRLRDWVLGALPALGVGGVGLAGTAPAGHNQPGSTAVDAVAYALVAVAAMALVVRRLWPLVTLGVVSAAVSAYLVLGYPYGPVVLSFVVAVYTVASWLPTRLALAGCLGALGVLLAHVAFGSGSLAGVAIGMSWVAVPFAVGAAARLARESAARSREEAARERAYAERMRVAQEVHDVVGHGLAAIHLQAEVALHVLPNRPEQAVVALESISWASKEALAELRATLDLVRGRDALDRVPSPGLARLDDLVRRLSGTGVPVSVEVTGERGSLPAAVDLAAYRVVQESLTNVLRHAGPATATVRVDHRPDVLTVEVRDTGHSVTGAAAGSGHGISGMRERVTALGGELTAGPGDGGGFAVRAVFPLAPALGASGVSR